MSPQVIILGAGAAGLHAAAQVARQGLRVTILERNAKPGMKILISGGGRCNFTNRHAQPHDYVSENAHFMKSALKRFTPDDFVQQVVRYGIAFEEKHRGQLFATHSSRLILGMLMDEARNAGAVLQCGVNVNRVEATNPGFRVCTDTGEWMCDYLVVATGGLSYPQLGVSDLGYRIAKDFGHRIIPTRPALVPLVWSPDDEAVFGSLAGVSLPMQLRFQKNREEDDALFTHRGLSGPVSLRHSLHWHEGPFHLNFLDGSAYSHGRMKAGLVSAATLRQTLGEAWAARSASMPRRLLANSLPERLADVLLSKLSWQTAVNQLSKSVWDRGVNLLGAWPIIGAQLDSWKYAEVTRGGVSTEEVSSQTMESLRYRGLFFIGEVLDVTGDLGGFNFQWAWASASAVRIKDLL
jgi:hypothetical protein